MTRTRRIRQNDAGEHSVVSLVVQRGIAQWDRAAVQEYSVIGKVNRNGYTKWQKEIVKLTAVFYFIYR